MWQSDWLNVHKLTLNVAKSKFMIIGSSKRLKALGTFSLQICDEFLDKANCYKYLGVIINETLTWSDHVDYISTKVNQRLAFSEGSNIYCQYTPENFTSNQ